MCGAEWQGRGCTQNVHPTTNGVRKILFRGDGMSLRSNVRRYFNHEKILKRDGYICGYCFERRATQVDHIVPVTYLQMNEESNLIACCEDCNRIAGNKVFDSIQEKREYIQGVLKTAKWATRRAAQVVDSLPLNREVEDVSKKKERKRRIAKVSFFIRKKREHYAIKQGWHDGALDSHREKLNHLHIEMGFSWRKISRTVSEYRGISAPSLRRIAMGIEPGRKVRCALRLPAVSTVIVVGGASIPPGAQVVSAARCECGQWFVSNSPRRKRCFICSPFRGKGKT